MKLQMIERYPQIIASFKKITQIQTYVILLLVLFESIHDIYTLK